MAIAVLHQRVRAGANRLTELGGCSVTECEIAMPHKSEAKDSTNNLFQVLVLLAVHH